MAGLDYGPHLRRRRKDAFVEPYCNPRSEYKADFVEQKCDKATKEGWQDGNNST
jgi:hypothetical protein